MLDFFAMRGLKWMMLAVLGLAVCLIQPVHAQTQGLALITTPLDNAVVSGIVPILGTATHPQLLRYELAFSYNANPTDTWFSIHDPVKTQVVNGILGRWDTTGITDGIYILRLRVYWSDRQFTEAFVRGVRVQNATPTPPPAAPPTLTPAPTVLRPSATPAIVLPPTSTPRPTTAAVSANGSRPPSSQPPSWLDTQTIRSALMQGMLLTGFVFAIVGLYAGLRAALRYKPRR
jgi:hypothetical protein